MELTFKQAVAADIENTFFCAQEHADIHTVDGKKMLIVLDENELLERAAHWEGGAKQSFDQGLYQADKLFYVKVKDYGKRPRIGKPLRLDGGNYFVTECTEEAGVYAISIQRVRQ